MIVGIITTIIMVTTIIIIIIIIMATIITIMVTTIIIVIIKARHGAPRAASGHLGFSAAWQDGRVGRHRWPGHCKQY